MSGRWAWMLASVALLPAPALAAPGSDGARDPAVVTLDRFPAQLSPAQRDGYRAVFAAIHDARWQDAQLGLDAMPPGPLHAIARAELYTAHGSPKVDAAPIVDLLTQAPELPEAEQLARLARAKGAAELPELPVAQHLLWIDGAPNRARAKSNRSDLIAADLAAKMQPYVKDDLGQPAQALLEATDGLSPEALTEWQQKVGWIYYLSGDDARARAMEAKAASGTGDWALQAQWVGALAAWRQGDCAAAGKAFEDVASRSGDTELRAAGLYWTARADMRCGRPDRVEARLKNASQYRETFYGLLSRQALGIVDPKQHVGEQFITADWTALERRPNIRVVTALVELGEDSLAEQVIRRQAQIGSPSDYPALSRLAARLDLPATALWLSHNAPAGASTPVVARYPAPSWTPEGGWRVDKALVWAHTLQESQFRNRLTSPAGAYGLMQIMPAAATDFAREQGVTVDRSALTRPGFNIGIGQRHLERLRDMSGVTGGLLPKVIAAYNAGPRPVELWNVNPRDGGDPLLYIESIPYWETRGYVMTVLRNYWMYEGQGARAVSSSRSALAQGMWPRFPGLPGPAMVRIARPIPPYVPPAAPAASAVAMAGAAAARAN